MARLRMEHLYKRYGDGTQAISDLNLEVEAGDFVVLVGPSGCGKTTALRMVAGLEDITDGRMIVGNKVVNNLPPKARDIAMVFQSYALYPHMTVAQNMGFALKMAKFPKAEIDRRVAQAAAMLGIEEQLNRKPRHLSGGQRQRVAMGRAIVRNPQAFLMDEPLSNLDAKLRVQMRSEIAHLQRRLGVTTLYVTHDQIEAMTMGDRVAVLRLGILQQFDTPDRLFSHPANLFVASFIGSPAMNLVHGSVHKADGGLAARFGSVQLGIADAVLDKQPRLEARAGRDVAVGLRPDYFFRPDSSVPAERRFKARVERVELLGTEVLAHLDIGAQPVVTDQTQAAYESREVAEDMQQSAKRTQNTIIAKFPVGSKPTEGEEIEVGFDIGQLHFFDLETSDAIQ